MLVSLLGFVYTKAGMTPDTSQLPANYAFPFHSWASWAILQASQRACPKVI